MGQFPMSGRVGIIGRLSALQVRRLRKPGKYHDGGGLYFLVHPGGSRSWAFRCGPGGKTWAGIGPLHTVGLAEARDRAKAMRLQVVDGIDPLAARRGERQAARIAAAKSMSFADCAKAYHQAHSAGWRNPRHVKDWLAALNKHAFPVLGAVPVADVDTALVCKVIEPMWTNKTATAARVRSRIEQVSDWAKVRGYRSGENPARWKGHLDHLLPGHKSVNGPKNFAALPYAQAPAFMARLRAVTTVEARCLEFLILTVSRLTQACEAPWSEIDFKAELWTIPKERMKTGEEHIVPLCDRALAILRQLRADHPESDFIFPRQGGRKPIASRQVWVEAKRLAGKGATVHGFRSTFRDWATESRADYPDVMVEIALAHEVGDKAKRAYLRTKMIERRREMMAAWSAYCASASSDVIPLRGGRRHG
jgi:integrase